MADYRTILVPYDFSEHSAAALATAVDLARRLRSDLTLLHVVYAPVVAYPVAGAAGGPAVPQVELRIAAEEALAGVAQDIKDAPGQVDTRVVEAVNLAEAIRLVAEELRADLIVMGTHGRTGLAHAFLGSVTERALRTAPCPVLTVRGVEQT